MQEQFFTVVFRNMKATDALGVASLMLADAVACGVALVNDDACFTQVFDVLTGRQTTTIEEWRKFYDEDEVKDADADYAKITRSGRELLGWTGDPV